MEQTTQVPIRLTDLPLDLLLGIVEHLDNDVDRSCLVLSIHGLRAYFDEKPNHTLTPYLSSKWEGKFSYDDDELERQKVRYSILVRLSRDTPQYIPCWSCLERHHWRDIKLPGPKYTRPCRRKFRDDSFVPYDPPLRLYSYMGHDRDPGRHHFHFLHLQSIMRRVHYGVGFGITPESVSFVEVQTLHVWGETTKALLSFEARIHRLCVRVQELIIFKPPTLLRDHLSLNICRLTGTYTEWSSFKEIVKSHISDLLYGGNHHTPAHYGRCCRCDIG